MSSNNKHSTCDIYIIVSNHLESFVHYLLVDGSIGPNAIKKSDRTCSEVPDYTLSEPFTVSWNRLEI